MTRFLSRLLILVAVALTAMAPVRARAPKADDTAMLARKARYISLEASAALVEGRNADAYMLLRNAMRRDGANPYIRQMYYRTKAALDIADRAEIDSLLAVSRELFYLNPTDDYYAENYLDQLDMPRIDEAITAFRLLDSLRPSRLEPKRRLTYMYMLKASRGDSVAADSMRVIFDILRSRQPGNKEIAMPYVTALASLGDTAAAAHQLEELRAEAPADIEVLISVSQAYLHLNRPDSADAVIARALELAPEAGRVHFAKANLLMQRNDSAGYEHEMFVALEAPDMEYGEKYNILRSTVQRLAGAEEQRPRLERMFRALNAMHPGESTLHDLYGTYLSVIGDYEGAAEQFGYSVELDPDNLGVWRVLLECEGKIEDEGRYREVLMDARRRFPEDFELVIRHALMYAADSMYTESIALMDSLETMPVPQGISYSKIHEIKADIYSQMDSIDLALKEYDRAIDFDGEAYMAMNNAAYFLSLRNADLNKAALYAQMAVGSSPDNATYLDTYAWVKFKQRDFESALQLMDRALCASLYENQPEQADGETPHTFTPSDYGTVPDELWEKVGFDILDHAGDIYYFNGNTDTAVDFWRRALLVKPDDETVAQKVRARSVSPDFTTNKEQ